MGISSLFFFFFWYSFLLQCAERTFTGVTVKDVPAQDFINAYAQFLQRQGKLEVPGYVELVKTSAGNELPPQESETWFYKRAASAYTYTSS